MRKVALLILALACAGCQPPPVEVNVDPDVHIELPPHHHPLRPWLDEPKPQPELEP